ncbi:MAG: MFS transporter [Alphaproteobacteria bacterium]|nr:MFS transporter [Alphaproteobacteria bacterium]
MKKKILTSSIIGNALEFYDFTLCGVFVTALAREFFPQTDPATGILWGFSAFAAAFWTRPLGAFIFGHIGDKYGRKVALTWSVSLMGIPTLIISMLPSYAQIGILAPIILVLCRLMQGLCTGGEYNGAAIFALEHLRTKPGLISGLISGSCVIGALAAMIMGFITTLEWMPTWAWRVAFAFGALVSVIGFVIRRHTEESLEFLQTKGQPKAVPLQSVLKEDRHSFYMSIGLGLFNGVLTYTLFAFLSVYIAQYVGYTTSQGMFYNLFGLIAFMTLCPVFGAFSDQISPINSVKLAGRLCLLLPVLSFSLFQMSSGFPIIIGQLLLGTTVASLVGPSHYFLQTLFPTNNRYTGASVGFTIGMAITGGSTPIILTQLLKTTGYLMTPAVYLTLWGVLWLGMIAFFYPRTRVFKKTTHDIEPEEEYKKVARYGQ